VAAFATMANREFDVLLSQLKQVHEKQVKELDARLADYVSRASSTPGNSFFELLQLEETNGKAHTVLQASPAGRLTVPVGTPKLAVQDSEAPLALAPASPSRGLDSGKLSDAQCCNTLSLDSSTLEVILDPPPNRSGSKAPPGTSCAVAVETKLPKSSVITCTGMSPVQESRPTSPPAASARGRPVLPVLAGQGTSKSLEHSTRSKSGGDLSVKSGKSGKSGSGASACTTTAGTNQFHNGNKRGSRNEQHLTVSSRPSNRASSSVRERMRRFSSAMYDLQDDSLHPESPTGLWPLRLVVNSSWFELVFACLILINACIFALEVQISGWDKGVSYGYLERAQTYGNKAPWNRVIDVFEVMATLIGVAFSVEVCVKILGMGPRRFASDWWNWFDSMVVIGWLLEDAGGSLDLPLNARALRSFRLLRILRVLRLLRTIQLFDSLYLLNAALKRSIAVLTWSLVYLGVVQLSLALMLSELIHAVYLENQSFPHEEREQVFVYFGTFSRATLTMFEMTLANWPPVCRVMTQNVSEWWVLFALVHKLVLGFAVIGIINGVVMQETFKAAAQDKNVMVRDRQRQLENVSNRLRRLFDVADLEKDGYITVNEFVKMCETPELGIWLSSIGLSTNDAVKVFHLMDNGCGFLSADELVEGVQRFRGFASGIDLHISVQELHEKLHSTSDGHSKFLYALDRRIEEQTTLLRELAVEKHVFAAVV